jgi:hypothetical protein
MPIRPSGVACCAILSPRATNGSLLVSRAADSSPEHSRIGNNGSLCMLAFILKLYDIYRCQILCVKESTISYVSE